MVTEVDKMKNEVNGTAVKTESFEIKEESKEEIQKPQIPPPGTPEARTPNSHTNKLTNGDTDTEVKSESITTAQPSDKIEVKKENGNPPSTPEEQQSRSSKMPQSAAKAPAHGNQTPGFPVQTHQQPAPTVDNHFMQQHSQIFVFTTQFANKAAEAVLQHQYKNLLAYHMDQPSTKKFLQNFPANTGSGGHPMIGYGGPVMKNSMNMKNQNVAPNMTNPSSVAQWVKQQNAHLQEQGFNIPANSRASNFSPNNPAMQGPRLPAQFMHAQGQMRPGSEHFHMIPGMSEFDFDLNNPMGQGQYINLLHNKVPNENLTPEQLQRREEQLASLKKIQQMLFPEQWQHCFPGPGPGPESGMMPDGMNSGMMPQNMMRSPPGMMGSPQGMMGSPHGMLSPQQQMMMSQQQGMSQFGPGPHNMQNMNPAQRDWLRLQQDFYVDKRRSQTQPHNMTQQVSSGMEIPGSSHGPPPSYYSSIAQKRQEVVSVNNSTSPNMNGPIGSPQMPAQGQDQDLLTLFPPGASGQRRGSMTAMDQPGRPNSGMGCVPEFDSMMHGPMGPNMPPGMIPMNNVPPHMKNAQVTLQRAGNPEPFQPDLPMSASPSNSGHKPPPSYAQSTKRKRDEYEAELCKNLQPTPSPQQINYLNQFEGQELTITKQLNTAFREKCTESQPNPNHFPPVQVPHSPMHGPNSNKGPLSNSSQNSSAGPLSSPGPVPGQGPGPIPGPGPSPISGANMRLSHFDPPSISSASSAPSTPTGKSAISNITSASLASLAKGVEHLSNQMQQNMMQGGPFHSIQVQGQQMNNNNSNSSSNGSVTAAQMCVSQPTTTCMTPSSAQTPSVNNTFVNATMSIQQLNIQNVSNTPGQNCNPSMQVQQMGMEQQQQMMAGGPVPSTTCPQGPMPVSASGQGPVSGSGTAQSGGPIPGSGPGIGPIPGSGPGIGPIPGSGPGIGSIPGIGPIQGSVPSVGPVPGSGQGPVSLVGSGPSPLGGPGAMHPGSSPTVSTSSVMQQHQSMMVNMGGHPGMGKAQSFHSPQPTSPMMQPSGRMSSPNYLPAGSANVQIQAKAPNTIQYLPANPPQNQPNMSQKRPDLEFMQRFAPPLTNLDSKPPSSKLQYFPGNSPSYPKRPGSSSPFSTQPGPGVHHSMMMRAGSGPDIPSMTALAAMNSMGVSDPGAVGPMMRESMREDSMRDTLRDSMTALGTLTNSLSPDPLSQIGGGMSNMGSGPSLGMPGMGGMPGMPYSTSPYPGNAQLMMNSGMMQAQQMQMQQMQAQQMQMQMHSPGQVPGQSAGGMSAMSMQGPYSRQQPNPGVRIPMNANLHQSMPGPGPVPGSANYNAQFQQFQQQLYSQGHPRQLSPMSMMGSAGHSYMGSMGMFPGPN